MLEYIDLLGYHTLPWLNLVQRDRRLRDLSSDHQNLHLHVFLSYLVAFSTVLRIQLCLLQGFLLFSYLRSLKNLLVSRFPVKVITMTAVFLSLFIFFLFYIFAELQRWFIYIFFLSNVKLFLWFAFLKKTDILLVFLILLFAWWGMFWITE